MGHAEGVPFPLRKGLTVRIRSLAALSTVVTATLLLAGCAGDADTAPTTEPTEAVAEGCYMDLADGDVSNAVVVEGSGADATITVPEGLEFGDLERTVLTAGTGVDVVANDLVSLRYRIVDAVTGETLDSSDRGEDGLVDVLLSPDDHSLFVVALECEPIGSQIVLTVPGEALGGGNSIVVVAEAVEHLPTVATGTDVAPAEGMPTVELDDDGAPTITIPEAEAPTATRVEVLKQGDGAIVEAGDLVVVQYRGVAWSTGEEFDSSWGRGAPAAFATTGVVTGFQQALEGQKVGSQVIVVMPPEDAYAGTSSALADETLVFVIDILATSSLEE